MAECGPEHHSCQLTVTELKKSIAHLEAELSHPGLPQLCPQECNLSISLPCLLHPDNDPTLSWTSSIIAGVPECVAVSAQPEDRWSLLGAKPQAAYGTPVPAVTWLPSLSHRTKHRLPAPQPNSSGPGADLGSSQGSGVSKPAAPCPHVLHQHSSSRMAGSSKPTRQRPRPVTTLVIDAFSSEMLQHIPQ